MGALDKELIRKVIRHNRSQTTYCFESQLAKFPKLVGTIGIKFVINAQGEVAMTSVAQSSVDNPELERCVAGRVKQWMFPKPKGGGIAVVLNPFVFP